MKTIKLLIPILLISNLLSGQSVIDEDEASLIYEGIMQDFNCPDPSAIVNAVLPIPLDQAGLELPQFGINGQLSYPGIPGVGDNYIENATFGDSDLRDVLALIGYDELRFPGGTNANSYRWYSTEIEVEKDAGGNIIDLNFRHHITDPFSVNDDITPPTNNDANTDYFLFEEGSIFQNGANDGSSGYLSFTGFTQAEKRNSQFGKPILQGVSQIELAVFPNPASDFLTLDINHDGELVNRTIQYRIKDVRGVVLSSGAIQKEMRQQLIDISSLIEGIYTLSVLHADEIIGSVKFELIR